VLWVLCNHLVATKSLNVDLKEDTLIIYSTYGTTTFIVISNASIAYNVSHDFGIARVYKALSDEYGITEKEAASMLSHGGLPPDYYNTVVDPILATIIKEIAHLYDYMKTEYAIKNAVLLGEAASFSMHERLSHLMHLPVHVPDVFSSITVPLKFQSFIKAHPHEFDLALALAIRGLMA
jgi:Tfp pilus assembly PilM family ATPase